MRHANSNIVEQGPILAQALEQARKDLPETTVRDISSPFNDYTLDFDLITEYDPALCPAGLSPIAWTKGSWNAYTSQGDAAQEVQKAVAEHKTLLADIHAGEYAPTPTGEPEPT